MSIQTIKYNTRLSPVAVDDAGNLVIDNAGNLVIPIKPIYITVGADDVNGTCGSVELLSDTYTFTAKVCESNLPYRENTKHWLGKSDSIYGIQCVSNLRNSTESIVDFDIYAGIEKRRTPGKFDASGTRIGIRWGDDSVSSGEYYVCQQGQEMHYLGTVTVDLETLTLTYNTDGVPYPIDPALIDCEQEETEEIVIDADYRWCSAFIDINGDVVSVTGTVYTEQGSPEYDSLVWSEQHNEIEISANDDYNETLRDAALTTVASTETRKFITCDNHTGTFWRDETKDSLLGYKDLACYELVANFGDNPAMYASQIPAYSGRYCLAGTIWKKATQTRYPSADVAEQYLANDANVLYSAESEIQWAYGIMAWLHKNPAGQEEFVGLQLVPTGKKNGEYLEHTTLNGEFSSVWLSEYIDDGNSYYGAYFGSVSSNNFVDDAISRYQRDYVEISGIKYFHPVSSPYSRASYVFEKNTMPAWSLSPCYQLDSAQNTVYTNTENPSVGDEYTVYDLASDYFWSAGNVTGAGEGTYSITGANGTTYYNSGYVGEATDEEFE